MTFKQLAIGAQFEFSIDPRFQFSGFERGPWIKRSARCYDKAEPTLRPMRCQVGSVTVEVEVLP